MHTKTTPLAGVKAGPDDGLEEGEFIVYPSTFTEEPDSYGDIVKKGAFADTIKAWKASGDVMPGMYLHDPNQIVSLATDMGEDDHGWWVRGKFDDDPHAQRVYGWLKSRRLSALSFGFQTKEEGKVQLKDGRSANELRKLDASEFSFLPKGWAANPDAGVVDVKSTARKIASAAGRVQAAKSDDELSSALISLAEHMKSLGEEMGAEKSPVIEAHDDTAHVGPVSATSEEPVGAKEQDATPVTASAKYMEQKLKLYKFRGREV